MEEILASIKRIIAEDDPPQGRRGQAAAPPVVAPVEDVARFEAEVNESFDDLMADTQDGSAPREGETELGFELEDFEDGFADEADMPRTGTGQGASSEPLGGSAALDAIVRDFGPLEDDILPDEDETLEDLADSLAGSQTASAPAAFAPEPQDDQFTPVAPLRTAMETVPAMTAKPALAVSSDRLLDDTAALAAASSMSRLIGKVDLAGDTSLEGIVREMLRPMIKEWLDAHLPAIVEAKVEQAVDRIVKLAR
jgi:hypothetical protein